jgi:hypothetical protein
MNPFIEIVVARYNEDLSWTNEFPFNRYKYTVYNKGNNELFEKKHVTKVIPLENVGKCDHTYMYHIVKNYNHLAPITVFIPGSIEMSNKRDIAIRLLSQINKNKRAVFLGISTPSVLQNFNQFQLDSWTTSNQKNYESNKETKLFPSRLRPFGTWFRYQFGNIKVPYYCHFGIFSVSKIDVIKHSMIRYKKILRELRLHSNPEVGHYVERAWGAIFYPLINTKYISTATNLSGSNEKIFNFFNFFKGVY